MKALFSLLFSMLLIASSSVCFAQISINAGYKASIIDITRTIGEDSHQSGSGISLDALYNIPISTKYSLNLETGLGFHYLFFNDSMYYKSDLSNVYLPVRVSHDIPLNQSITLAPYAGLYARYFLHYNTYKYSTEQGSSPTVVNVFKTIEEGEVINRGLVGGQLGLLIKGGDHFILELGYGFDFTKFIKSWASYSRIHTFSISIGYSF